MGCVVTWVTWYVGFMGPWVRGLRESKFYVGCVGYVGQNIFFVSQHFTWVMIFA